MNKTNYSSLTYIITEYKSKRMKLFLFLPDGGSSALVDMKQTCHHNKEEEESETVACC